MDDDEMKTDGFNDTALSPFDLVNGAANKLDPPAGFDGPVQTRRITDPLCLLILLSMWGITTWIGVWSIENGNIDTIIHPADYKGRLCGVDEDSNGKTLPSHWHPVDIASNGVCLEECPPESILEPTSINDLICKEDDDILQIEGCAKDGTLSNDPSVLVTCGGCMYQIGSSALNFHCTPAFITPLVSKVNGEAKLKGLDTTNAFQNFDYASYTQRLIRDLRTSYPVVFGIGCGGTILIGALFLFLIRYSSSIGPLIWTSAGVGPLVLGGAGALLFFLSNDYSLDDTGLHSTFGALFTKIVAYTLWALTGITLCSLVIMKEKISQAISVSKAVSRAVNEMPLVFVVAISQTIAFILLIGSLSYWMLLLAAPKTFSAETSTIFGNEVSHISQAHPVLVYYMTLFLIIVAAWTSEFINVLGQLTLSLCVSKWYYTPEKEEGNDVSVFGCLGIVMLKHAGTAAFGSMFTKPICILRSPILLIQSSIRRSGADNVCIDILICCCQCNLFILERFLKFANNMSYHHTVLFGSSFCKSSHQSYYLNRRNEDFMTEAGCLPFISTIYCKIFIISSASTVSFVMLDSWYGDIVYSTVSVTAITVVLSWFISGFFTNILGGSISTLLYCFVADEEIMGSEGSPFVTTEFYDFLDNIYASSTFAGDDIEHTEEGVGVEMPIPKRIDLL